MEEFAELICIADKPYMKRIFNLLNQELLYLKQLNIQIPTVEMVGTKEIKHSQGLQEPGSSHEWFNSYHSEPHIQSRERNYRIYHLESPKHHTEQYITHLKDGNWSIFMQQGAQSSKYIQSTHKMTLKYFLCDVFKIQDVLKNMEYGHLIDYKKLYN